MVAWEASMAAHFTNNSEFKPQHITFIQVHSGGRQHPVLACMECAPDQDLCVTSTAAPGLPCYNPPDAPSSTARITRHSFIPVQPGISIGCHRPLHQLRMLCMQGSMHDNIMFAHISCTTTACVKLVIAVAHNTNRSGPQRSPFRCARASRWYACPI